MSLGPSEASTGTAKRRRGQEGVFQKWKYRVPGDGEESTAKRQRNSNTKKVKERMRRTRMAEAVQNLRDAIPYAKDTKINQALVLVYGLDYIRKLEAALKAQTEECDKFRAFFSEKGAPLPPTVSVHRLQFDVSAPAVDMGESGSDEDSDESTSRSSASVPVAPVAPKAEPTVIVTPPPAAAPSPFLSQQKVPSTPNFAPFPVPAPSFSTPIPIPGTVGAPIRPHEARTRLERVTGSSQHLVNKNHRANIPPPAPLLFSQPPKPASSPAHTGSFEAFDHLVEEALGERDAMDEGKGKEEDGGEGADMMEQDLMHDIEEVGKWPLFTAPTTCQDPQCPQFHEHQAHSQPITLAPLQTHSPLPPLHQDSPTLMPMYPKADSPFDSAKNSPKSPFGMIKSSLGASPKLVFVDSPSTATMPATFSYQNPFDAGYSMHF